MRCRCSCGRMSPTRCVAPLVVAVGMAVETRDAAMRFLRAPVAGHVELLLRKRREQQAQAVELLRIQDAVEKIHEIVDRHALALRHIAEVGPRGEKDGRGKFRQEMIGQIEVEIEARQVALLLFLQLLDLELRKEHAAFGMIRMRQREESRGPNILFADLLRRHFRELFPCDALGQSNPHALLHRLFPRHRHAGRRIVAQVVAFGEQIVVLLFNPRLLRLHPLHRRLEIFASGPPARSSLAPAAGVAVRVVSFSVHRRLSQWNRRTTAARSYEGIDGTHS